MSYTSKFCKLIKEELEREENAIENNDSKAKED